MSEKIHKNLFRNIVFVLAALMIMAVAVWGPEKLAQYHDNKVLNQITAETMETGSEGYRYSLSSNEKLYILSRCLDNQILPESELSAATRVESSSMAYQNLTGSYAFVVNYQGPSDKEITEEEIYERCNEGLKTLCELGILPDALKTVTASSYEAILYSAIDVLEPRNNLAVWKVNLATGKRNADKEGRLLDAYIDADTGHLYEFYARIDKRWEEIDADAIMEKWCEYMGLTGAEPLKDVNPLLETTPYFCKYTVPGTGEGNTTVTIGFYEGINELFLKVSK